VWKEDSTRTPPAPSPQPPALNSTPNYLRDALTLPPILIVSRERQRGFSSLSSFSSLSPSILPRTSDQTTSAIISADSLSPPAPLHSRPRAYRLHKNCIKNKMKISVVLTNVVEGFWALITSEQIRAGSFERERERDELEQGIA
jgi:hypothetical protein